MRLSLLILVLFSVVVTGCGANVPAQSWASGHGGVLNDSRSLRLNNVLAKLTVGHPEINVRGCVLASESVCAYAWPNGTIYVTRGLMDRADDDILAAAAAHEVGHLLSDGHVPAVASLKGCNKDRDVEERADAYGIGLLRLQHIPDQAMARMLILVRDSNKLPPDCRTAMSHRIELVTTDATTSRE